MVTEAGCSSLEESKRTTCVVTGCSSGIGKAIVTLLLKERCTVFGSVRKEADAKKLQEEFDTLPGSFQPLLFDLTDAAAIAQSAQHVSEQLHGCTLSALFNNAGVNVAPDPLELIPLDKFRHQLEVNLVGPIAVTQAFLPLLGTDRMRSGAPGRVVNIGSIYGSYGIPWQGAYCATKFGLEGLSDALRVELSIFGIKVVLIRPGPVSSEIWDKGVKSIAAGEAGSGNWDTYSDTQYGAAMEATRKFLLQDMESKSFFLPCEDVAKKCWEAITVASPATQYLVTSRYLDNWVLPVWAPKHIVGQETARRLGIKALPPIEDSKGRKEPT